ncbi:MAG: MFS transporter [Saprospiraceae bacterium]|nr:MFS transporter [Saprospiraceae bacterium]MBP6568829.1 MFS transporter [Saprospiraceae bacterium]
MNIRLQVINKEFTFLLISRIVFTSGMKMVPVLLGWYLYELTGSKLALGILGLSEVIPAVLLALPAGVRVDSSPKKALILKCLLAYIGIALAFAAVTSELSGSLSSTHKTFIIYGIVGLTGLVRAYISPSFSAIIAQIVQPDELVKAASLNSMSWLIAAVMGPLLAGFMVGFWQVSFSFILISFLMVITFFIFSQIGEKQISYDKGKSRTWESVKEGVDFVWKQKALLGAMGLDMFAVLFGGAIALLPVFAKDILQLGPQAFGLLMSATYLGNFIAIFFLTKYPLINRQGYKLIYSVAGFGICIIIFALSEVFWLSFLALLVSGLFDGVSVIIRGTIFQLLVPDHMRGRVSSVSSLFVNSSNELGQFESGVAASLLGTVPSVIFGGCMTLLVTAIAWIKTPALKKLEY